MRGEQEQRKDDARWEDNTSSAEAISQPTGQRTAEALQKISKRERERYAGAARMKLLSQWFDENAKRIDDDGGIAKTKTDSSNYDNPPTIEELRVLARPGLHHASWLIEMRGSNSRPRFSDAGFFWLSSPNLNE